MSFDRNLGTPNLWDQSGEARQNMLKGLEGVRNYRGPLGDNSASAWDYAKAGNAATTQALDMYGQQAMGLGPSLAQGTMQQGLEANNRAALGMLGQARGGNVAGAYQQALGAQSGANMMTAQQGAMNAMAEQQAGLAGYAGLAQSTSQLGLGYSASASQHQLQADQNDLAWYAGRRGLDMQQQAQNRDFTMGLVNAGIAGAGAISSAIGGGGAMSDPRAKIGLQPASVADAAAEVGGFGYEYKPGLGQPGGPQMGVDASQLAQTSLGPTLVQPGPDGMLRVDGERAGIAGLAASGENTRRIQQLEQQLAMSQGGTPEQMYGTAEQGQARTREAGQLSNEIAMQRGLGQVQRARGGPPTDFGGMPAMQRGGQMAMGAPRTIDPFGPEAPPQRMADPYGGEVAVLPRRRSAPQVQSGGMRGQNVGAIYDENGNARDYRANIVPYEQGSAAPMRADLRRPETSEPISPEWQAAIDAMNDYNDQWLVKDETGRTRFAGQRLDLGQPDRGLQREIDALDAADRDRAIMEQDRIDAARPRPQRML